MTGDHAPDTHCISCRQSTLVSTSQKAALVSHPLSAPDCGQTHTTRGYSNATSSTGSAREPYPHLAAKALMNGVGGHGLGLHVEVPQLERHVVPRQDVPPVARELDVGHAGNDLAEEGPRALQGSNRLREVRRVGQSSSRSEPSQKRAREERGACVGRVCGGNAFAGGHRGVGLHGDRPSRQEEGVRVLGFCGGAPVALWPQRPWRESRTARRTACPPAGCSPCCC